MNGKTNGNDKKQDPPLEAIAIPAEPAEPVIRAEPTRTSAEIGELVGALAAAQLEFGEIKKNSANPYYKSKYADLSSVIAATQKSLAQHGLVVMQFPVTTLQDAGVDCILAHKSGQWIARQFLLPMSKIDPQGAGSAVTYARRYGYQSIIGVAADEDDDGAAASGTTAGAKPPLQTPQRSSAQKPPQPRVSIQGVVDRAPAADYQDPEPFPPDFEIATEPTITEKQRRMLFAVAKEAQVSEERIKQMLDGLGIQHTKDIPASKFDAILQVIRGGK